MYTRPIPPAPFLRLRGGGETLTPSGQTQPTSKVNAQVVSQAIVVTVTASGVYTAEYPVNSALVECPALLIYRCSVRGRHDEDTDPATSNTIQHQSTPPSKPRIHFLFTVIGRICEHRTVLVIRRVFSPRAVRVVCSSFVTLTLLWNALQIRRSPRITRPTQTRYSL